MSEWYNNPVGQGPGEVPTPPPAAPQGFPPPGAPAGGGGAGGGGGNNQKPLILAGSAVGVLVIALFAGWFLLLRTQEVRPKEWAAEYCSELRDSGIYEEIRDFSEKWDDERIGKADTESEMEAAIEATSEALEQSYAFAEIFHETAEDYVLPGSDGEEFAEEEATAWEDFEQEFEEVSDELDDLDPATSDGDDLNDLGDDADLSYGPWSLVEDLEDNDEYNDLVSEIRDNNDCEKLFEDE